MVEVTKGIFEASKEIYSNNRGSILRTIVYTVGHFAIAITVLMLVADVSFMIALNDIGSINGNKIRGKYWTIADESGKEVSRDVDIDESKYTQLLPEFEKTYFKEVYEKLSKKFKLGRVRLLLKEPRSTLSWHKDPECRLHVPIITNQGCSMVIENVAKHLPADGKVWITNNTKYHNFFNGGEQSRIHLVACVLESPFK